MFHSNSRSPHNALISQVLRNSAPFCIQHGGCTTPDLELFFKSTYQPQKGRLYWSLAIGHTHMTYKMEVAYPGCCVTSKHVHKQAKGTAVKHDTATLPQTCIDGFHGTFYHGNWRTLRHHTACWLVNIHITWPFALQLPWWKDAMESICKQAISVKQPSGCVPKRTALEIALYRPTFRVFIGGQNRCWIRRLIPQWLPTST